MKPALTFPGQGSHKVGMGQALAEVFGAARHVFKEVDDALGEHLSRIIFEGPEDQLRLTENAQPALMAVSMAALRVLEAESGYPAASLASVTAGHSLGEYSALAAAGSMSVADAARLLRRRGQAMQRAVAVGEGAMAALLGIDLEEARLIVAEAAGDEVCATANDNAPGQVVVSGHRLAVDRAIALASERGARKCILLPVSAPFHCALMAPAADDMEEALAEIDIAPPAIPVVANVSARPETDPARIRMLLVEQITAMVRWRESVAAMAAAGATTIVEIGAGRVLSALVRRIDRDLKALSVQGPQDIDAFLGTL